MKTFTLNYWRTCLSLGCAFFLSGLRADAADQQIIGLQQSSALVAQSDAVQHFTGNINVGKGQDQLHLTLTYANGSTTAPSFRWLRISSPSMSYITERQFAGGKNLSIDVAGALAPGSNQLLITAQGPKGASLSWDLTTPRPIASSISIFGSSIIINGNNFSPDPSADAVAIGGQSAKVISASPDKIVAQLPQGTAGGAQTAVVKIAGIDAGSLPITVDAVPVLKSLSNVWSWPGGTVTIYGENFSPNAGKTEVYVGTLQAEVVESSHNSITVVMPSAYTGTWGVNQPVRVVVDGVRARNQLIVNVTQTNMG
jgi:IPT/TIG domain